MAERTASPLHDAPAFELHIERLVLHGFSPADRTALAGAIERELARLFTAGGVPDPILERGRMAGDWRVYRLDAGSFDLPYDASPEVVGVQAARAIHRLLGGAEDAGKVAGPSTSHGARRQADRTPGSGGSSP